MYCDYTLRSYIDVHVWTTFMQVLSILLNLSVQLQNNEITLMTATQEYQAQILETQR